MAMTGIPPADIHRTPRSIPRSAAWGVCFLATFLGLRWTANKLQIGEDVLPWDPTAGVTLAFLVLGGIRFAPVVFLAVLGSLAIHISGRIGWLSIFNATVVSVLYSAAAWTLTRICRIDPRLSAQRDVVWYVAVSLLLPVPLAMFAAWMHWHIGILEPHEIRSAVGHYWMVEAIGLLNLGPLVLLTATRIRDGLPKEERRARREQGAWRWLETLGQYATAGLALWSMFFWSVRTQLHTYYLALPPLVWMLLRRGLWGAVTGTAAISAAAMVLAWWVKLDDTRVQDLQAFMLVMSVTGLLLGGLASGRVRVESRLAESEERYRVLFENNPHPMWVYDRTTLRFLDVNAAAMDQYGYSREEFLAMSLSDIRPPEEPIPVVPAGQTPPTVQRSGIWRHRKKDGTLIEVDIVSSQMRLLGPDARLVLARDVTETRKAERAKQKAESALREALQRLVSHVDNSPLAVIEWDDRFRVLRWSGEAERIFGWSPKEVLGRRPSEWRFVHEGDAAAVARVMDELSSGSHARNFSANRNYDKSGSVLHCEWHNSILKDDSGRVVSVLSLVSDVTPRVRAQEALRANEERFMLVVRGANDGVWDWNIGENKVYWSPRYHELIGDPECRLAPSYETWEQSLYPSDRERVLSALERHLRDRAPFDVEYRSRTIDGGWRWYRARGQAVWDSEGVPTRMAGSIADVTDRRAAQEALKETAEKYQSLVETTNTGYAATDETGRIIDANAEYVRLTGHLAVEDILGRTPIEWTAPHDQQRNRASFSQLSRSGSIRGLEIDYLHKDGRHVPVEINATRVTTALGTRVLALVRDISQRRRAEAAVREWKNRYEAAAGASRQLVYEVVQETGNILWGGPCEPLFGCEAGRVATLTAWIERVHPEDRAAYEAARNRVREERGTFHLEYRVRREDGTYVPVEDTARCFESGEGGGVRMVGFVADVTERVRAREELAHRARELARSNAELERFAYVASHDLQEPLRMVTSFTQLLADRYRGKLDSDADEFIGYAVEGATRMRRLIDDLLAYSRVGSSPRRRQRVRCAEAAERALSNLAASMAESGAEVELGELPEVTADELQLTLVFQNLIGNAMKFRKDGIPPRIKVCAVKEDEAWRIMVEDNGIGIEAKHRERVFAMFQRLNPRSHYPGNGIGLTICKRIVEDLGGAIRVDAAPGGGSVFSFTIPEVAVNAQPVEEVAT